MNKKVGRPITKKNRVKIGLSLEGESNNVLNKLTILCGKTKSRIIEEAIDLYYEKEIGSRKHKNNFTELSAMENFRNYIGTNKRS